MLPQTGRKSCNKNKIAELVKQCPQNPRQVSKELLLSPAAARPARTHGHAHTTGTDGDSHSRGHRLKAKGDKVWQEEDVASLTWPAGRGSGEEGLWKEWGLSWGAGKAGQAGKSKEGKEGCMPHRHAQSGVCHTSTPRQGPHHPAQGTQHFPAPARSSCCHSGGQKGEEGGCSALGSPHTSQVPFLGAALSASPKPHQDPGTTLFLAGPCWAVCPSSCSALITSPIPTRLPHSPHLVFHNSQVGGRSRGHLAPLAQCLWGPIEDGKAT